MQLQPQGSTTTPCRCRTVVRYLVLVSISVVFGHTQPSTTDTIRFLEQATFGPNSSLIAHVQSVGFEGFLQEQFGTPPTSYPHLDLYPNAVPMTCTGACVRDNYSMYPLQVMFFQRALTGPDQLRQRVAFALQQIMVASGLTVTQPSWMTPYLQIFDNDAFGNFRKLLSDITLNPAMGVYLNMAGNNKNAPNENYGREVLQLFSVGLNLLNTDGSLMTDPQGNPVPTYTQPVVTAFSRVFTGWNLKTPAFTSQQPGFSSAFCTTATPCPDYIDPMVVAAGNHDAGAKTLLNGVTVPAHTPVTVASANADLNAALDNIYNHPNVGPFICRNLIEHLVTSNPLPSYISSCASAFNNDGAGVRGNLQAVVREILLDPAARNSQVPPIYGHLQEPVLFIARFLRAFNTTSATTDFVLSDSYLPGGLQMGEDLFRSPSVFNYYPPVYTIAQFPGIALNGPEFSIQSTSTALARINFVAEATYHTMPVSNPNRPTGTWLDLSAFTPLAANPSQLIDALNTLLLHGQASSGLLSTVSNALASMSGASNLAITQRAVYLFGSSPEYFVER
jgi:uncharacterized protein (DUF1800 family)